MPQPMYCPVSSIGHLLLAGAYPYTGTHIMDARLLAQYQAMVPVSSTIQVSMTTDVTTTTATCTTVTIS